MSNKETSVKDKTISKSLVSSESLVINRPKHSIIKYYSRCTWIRYKYLEVLVLGTEV